MRSKKTTKTTKAAKQGTSTSKMKASPSSSRRKPSTRGGPSESPARPKATKRSRIEKRREALPTGPSATIRGAVRRGGVAAKRTAAGNRTSKGKSS
jgi:hypothetical protein